MSSETFYICDWCGERRPSGGSAPSAREFPEGWAYDCMTCGYHSDLLCAECVDARKESIEFVRSGRKGKRLEGLKKREPNRELDAIDEAQRLGLRATVAFERFMCSILPGPDEFSILVTRTPIVVDNEGLRGSFVASYDGWLRGAESDSMEAALEALAGTTMEERARQRDVTREDRVSLSAEAFDRMTHRATKACERLRKAGAMPITISVNAEDDLLSAYVATYKDKGTDRYASATDVENAVESLAIYVGAMK
jgi:hypothetical protein